jgi:hypothetical protein
LNKEDIAKNKSCLRRLADVKGGLMMNDTGFDKLNLTPHLFQPGR